MKKQYSNHFFGTRKSDNARITLTGSKWDCGWYWSFGYLGNAREHYHLKAYKLKNHFLKFENGEHKLLTEQRNKHMYDCLLEDYSLVPRLKARLWEFCELALTAYALKETAEVLGRGGSHTTSNPCADTIKNESEVKRINEKVLPAIFEQIELIFTTPLEEEKEQKSP